MLRRESNQLATDSPAPLYYQIGTQLRRRIRSGDLAPGARLPTDSELAREFGVSTITVRAAMRMLLSEALILRYPGKGTFVADEPPSSEVWGLGSIEDLIVTGLRSDLKVIWWRALVPSQLVVRKLGVPRSSAVWTLRLVRKAGGMPFIMTDLYYPPEVSQLLRKSHFTSAKVRRRAATSIMEERCGVRVTDVRQTMSAEIADEESARHLGVRVGVPLLVVQREFFEGRRMVQFGCSRYRTDHQEYVINLSRLGPSQGRGRGWS